MIGMPTAQVKLLLAENINGLKMNNIKKIIIKCSPLTVG
jgi:hypothetical protein